MLSTAEHKTSLITLELGRANVISQYHKLGFHLGETAYASSLITLLMKGRTDGWINEYRCDINRVNKMPLQSYL